MVRFVADQVDSPSAAELPIGCGRRRHLLVTCDDEVGARSADPLDGGVVGHDLRDWPGTADNAKRSLNAVIDLRPEHVGGCQVEAGIGPDRSGGHFERADADNGLPIADGHDHEFRARTGTESFGEALERLSLAGAKPRWGRRSRAQGDFRVTRIW